VRNEHDPMSKRIWPKRRSLRDDWDLLDWYSHVTNDGAQKDVVDASNYRRILFMRGMSANKKRTAEPARTFHFDNGLETEVRRWAETSFDVELMK